jgi:hypothetical protein
MSGSSFSAGGRARSSGCLRNGFRKLDISSVDRLVVPTAQHDQVRKVIRPTVVDGNHVVDRQVLVGGAQHAAAVAL